MAAPTSSLRTPNTTWPSKFVSSTTTSRGTRKIRVVVSALGRFMGPSTHMITSVVADESHPPGRWQGDAPPPAHDPYTEAHRPDFRAAVSALPARFAEAGAAD